MFVLTAAVHRVSSNLVFIGKKQKNYFKYSLRFLCLQDQPYVQRDSLQGLMGLSMYLDSQLRYISATHTEHKGETRVESGETHMQSSLRSLLPMNSHTGHTQPSATKTQQHACDVSAQGGAIRKTHAGHVGTLCLDVSKVQTPENKAGVQHKPY